MDATQYKLIYVCSLYWNTSPLGGHKIIAFAPYLVLDGRWRTFEVFRKFCLWLCVSVGLIAVFIL